MSTTLEQVILKDVRGSFVDKLFKLGKYKGKKQKKYAVTVIFDKEAHKQPLKMLKKQIKQLVSEELDGDEPEDRYMVLKNNKTRTKKGNRPEYKGFYTLKASNEDQPLFMDAKAKRMGRKKAKRLIYSGCRLNVKVSLWANDGDVGAVVGCNIITVQFAGNDERLGEGGIDAEEAQEGFKEVKGGKPFGGSKKKDKKGKKNK